LILFLVPHSELTEKLMTEKWLKGKSLGWNTEQGNAPSR
jgi:hypothetical protein